MAVFEFFMELAKPSECEVVRAWIFKYFFLNYFLFWLQMRKLEHRGSPGSFGQLLAPCLLCTHQDVLALAFRFPPAAEGLARTLDENKCLAGLLQNELKN